MHTRLVTVKGSCARRCVKKACVPSQSHVVGVLSHVVVSVHPAWTWCQASSTGGVDPCALRAPPVHPVCLVLGPCDPASTVQKGGMDGQGAVLSTVSMQFTIGAQEDHFQGPRLWQCAKPFFLVRAFVLAVSVLSCPSCPLCACSRCI